MRGLKSMNVSDELVKALADPKPLYALAGAGDLAAEKVKSASVRGPQAFLADLSDSVTSLATRVAAEAPDRFAKVTARLGEVPAAFDPKLVLDPKAAGDTLREAVGRPDVQALRDKAQTIALIQVGRVLEAAGKAVDTYDGLAVRGRGVVDRYRGGETPGTEESVTVVVEQVVPDDVLDRQNHEIKVESDIDEAVLAEESAAESQAQPQTPSQSHPQDHSQPHNGKPTPADAAAAARNSAPPRKRSTGPKGA
jgi:heparin binding hemagglutinin HbhA